MKGMPRPGADRPWFVRLLRTGFGVASLLVALGATYYAVKFTQAIFGDASFWAIMAGTFVVYVGLLFLTSLEPALGLAAPNSPLVELPHLVPALLPGMPFLLPIYLRGWCLLLGFLSTGLSAFLGARCLLF